VNARPRDNKELHAGGRSDKGDDRRIDAIHRGLELATAWLDLNYVEILSFLSER